MQFEKGDEVEYCGDQMCSNGTEGNGTVVRIVGNVIGVRWADGSYTEDIKEDLMLKVQKKMQFRRGDKVKYANLPHLQHTNHNGNGIIQYVHSTHVGVKWDDGLQCLERKMDLIPVNEIKIPENQQSHKRKFKELCEQRIKCDQIIAENQKRKKQIKKQIKALGINLVAEKKIEWVEMPFEKWLRTAHQENEYHIFISGKKTTTGIWKGLNKLNAFDLEHFEEFVYDYHWHGSPLMNHTPEQEKFVKSLKLKRLVPGSDSFYIKE